MHRIAIIDDNQDQSGTVKTNIELILENLGSSLEVITSQPFADPNAYFDFINHNEVCVLILDEMLNDQPVGNAGPVGYKGSELIASLRGKLVELPIFALTVIPTDEDLKHQYSQYEEIISRKEFYDHPDMYVPKFWRAAKNYLQANIDELNEFNKLTELLSSGDNDPDLIKKLKALQVKLELPYSGFDDRTAWLNKYEEQINTLEKLNEEIKSKLDKK